MCSGKSEETRYLRGTMRRKHIIAAGAVLLPVAPIQACQYEGSAPEDAEEEASEARQALSYTTFYISNPTGRADKLRVTASIESGAGQVSAMHIFDINSLYAMIDVPCGDASCMATEELYGCLDYGVVPVVVDYTGAVKPRLHFWFYDCDAP